MCLLPGNDAGLSAPGVDVRSNYDRPGFLCAQASPYHVLQSTWRLHNLNMALPNMVISAFHESVRSTAHQVSFVNRHTTAQRPDLSAMTTHFLIHTTVYGGVTEALTQQQLQLYNKKPITITQLELA